MSSPDNPMGHQPKQSPDPDAGLHAAGQAVDPKSGQASANLPASSPDVPSDNADEVSDGPSSSADQPD